VGASEPAKRPEPAFYAHLARRLADLGLTPYFLGGPGDTEPAAQAARMADLEDNNLAGRFSLAEFVDFGRTLDLFVTPDTGPMHVASFAGIRTLDLSLGPVSPWDTGPFPPGHFVLQAAVSCANCWRCARDAQPCRTPYAGGAGTEALAAHVAGLAAALVRGDGRGGAEAPSLPGMRLFRSARDAHGLYALRPADGRAQPAAREAVAGLWRAFFGARFGLWDDAALAAAWRAVAAQPRLAQAFGRTLPRLGAGLSQALRAPGGPALPPEFWFGHPLFLRPLTGFLQLFLQNANYAPPAFADALGGIERLAALVRA
jgi:hypothetical protein